MGKKLTIADIGKKKKAGEKITMLTAYEAGFARFVDQCGIDMVLVGDSLGNVALGYDSTVPVNMDEMIHHAKAARRGVTNSLLIGDMPFLSYQIEKHESIRNAGRFLKEAGCDAVKLEGGEEVCETVSAIVRAGISVMGHIGLTPQTASQLGGYKVQGRDMDSAQKMLAEAKALESAGAFAVVLECIPDGLAQVISESIAIPTIGIGAGPHCDGQVLVTHDLVGMFEKFIPSFVKQYAKLAPRIVEAISTFKTEVEQGKFPDAAHSFSSKTDFKQLLK